jgi:hypothetical protein
VARTDTRAARVLRRRTDRSTFAAIAPPASFLSHLIVGDARATGAPRGADRTNLALGAYATGSQITIRRLPAGYRTALDV